MSKRTSEANKAIANAWITEQQLVKDGKGTRDWTQEQQKDILDRGKAYDDNGKAFEGHHMMSAEKYPEYQGESKNIQFLSRAEHLGAHNGSFRNPTNGYFDPFTGDTAEFNSGSFEPCPVIVLSMPLNNPTISIEQQRSPHDAYFERNPTDQRRGITARLSRTAGNTINFISNHKAEILIGVKAAHRIARTIGKKSRPSNKSGNDSGSSELFNKGIDIASNKRKSPIKHTVKKHRQRYNNIWKDKGPYDRGSN